MQNQTIVVVKQLSPDSKEFRQALIQAARQANRLADAFGLKVPTNKAMCDKKS